MDNPCLILLGNKTDIPEDNWKVTQEAIDLLCEKKKLVYYATSAKENKGITESFTYIANLVYKKVEENKKKILKLEVMKSQKKMLLNIKIYIMILSLISYKEINNCFKKYKIFKSNLLYYLLI